ncbi:PFU-domain-containing protein [Parathielavia appendiculata]|uniref:PFU-domain-containing protein n=1 Tax=Parathielavia appendiculata TaxID=2587402 RepID=A0AAN6U312_9PEZI|nr:PFU-domain-containing protein [Parathielavia appendiculata]
MPDFKLSAQLKGHDADVRAVCFPAANTVLSSSRDQTVRLWRKTADKPPTFDATITSQGHGYINSLTFLRPSPTWSEGLVVSGGHEAIIEAKRPGLTAGDNADRLLVGHGHNVCTLDVSPRGAYVVSGGWDGKALVWDTEKWQISAQLMHQGEVKSVWAVLAYDEHTVITGSADTQIRIFDLRQVNAVGEVEPRRTLSTSSVVRALCKLPSGLKGHPSGAEFASAGNDGIIQLWKMNGTEVGTLRGHDSFIYSLACLPTSEIVSSGEDRTVRIWRGSECIQTITHPAISVWSVAVCPENGDFASGASDNVVRVFTRNADRTAPAEALSEFEESVRASAIPQQQLGTSINKERLNPKSWLLNNAGRNDGQVTTVLEDDGTIGAYQWSLGEQRWVHVGTVVDSTGSSGRKVQYNGQEYDFVFDVDIEEGKPPLKLPYNLSQNPYEAATKFLGDNELPISYIDEVAKFIVTNTKGAIIGQTAEASSADPYGRESWYQPDQAAPPKKFLPYTEYLALTQAKWEPVARKLKSLNEKHILAGNKHIAMNPDGVSRLESVLQATVGATNQKTAAPGLLEAQRSVYMLATQWPYGDRLPPLDVLRCFAAWPGAVSVHDSKYGSLVDIVLRGALDVQDPISSNDQPVVELIKNFDATKINVNNIMMALRAVTNLFATAEGRSLAASEAAAITTLLARVAGVEGDLGPIGPDNNNLQIALTSATFNLTCLAFNQRESVDLELLMTLCQVAEAVIRRQSDPEVLFRALMSLGMVLAIGGDARDLARTLEVGEPVGEAAKKSGEARIKALAQECLGYLRG